MDPSLQSIFLMARHISGKVRDRYLRAACGDDSQLREQVESLLAADAEAGSFLNDPPTAGESPSPAGAPQGTQTFKTTTRGDSPTATIGPYKLLQKIGEGGMGIVWMAEQTSPVQRRVALKVIKAGMDTRQVIARFESERQALAMLDHPNIARVLEAGAIPEGEPSAGRPYFVMELIKGVPITRYCDEHHLTTQERLELFLPVCHAITHAHQKGIIHRDLKPSNILVTHFDGRPMPKVIDFGLAKATSHRLTDKTMFTEFGQIMGTLEYMSPEQARMDQLDIDTRSDIYSLGVILYELLVGQTPFDAHRLRSAAFDELLRIVREEEPPHLSLRLSNSGSLPSIAANRRVEPKRLSLMMRGELDWIAMKTLEKDRDRRYQTINGLSRDIERYLADEPVEASPPSARYRFSKFLRRNRAAVLTSAAFLVALLLGFAGTTIGLIGQARERALAEERRAEAEYQRAEAERNATEATEQAAIAESVSAFQVSILEAADPDNMGGDRITVLQMLESAIEQLDKGELSTQPIVEANVRDVIGRSLNGLGLYERAEQQLRKALELKRRLLTPGNTSTGFTAGHLARALQEEGRYVEAERLYREALDVQRNATEPNQHDIAVALGNLGNCLENGGKYSEAEKNLREAVRMMRDQEAPDQVNFASSLSALADLARSQDKYLEAESLYREALQILRNVLPVGHPRMATITNNLAVLLISQGKYAEGASLLEESLSIVRERLPAGHPNIAYALRNLADLRGRQGRYPEAEQLLRESLEICRKSLPPVHPDTAVSLRALARLLHEVGQLKAAEPMAREALGISRQVYPKRHPELTNAITYLASLLGAFRNFEESETLFREALEINRNVWPEGHSNTANVLNNLAAMLQEQDRYVEAEPLCREALDMSRRVLPPGHPGIAPVLNNLAGILHGQEKYAESLPIYRELLQVVQRTYPAQSPYVHVVQNNLAMTLAVLWEFEEAEQLHREALAGFQRILGGSHWRVGDAGMGLGRVLIAQGRFTDAEPVLLEAERVLASCEGVEDRHQFCVDALLDLYNIWDKAVIDMSRPAESTNLRISISAQ